MKSRLSKDYPSPDGIRRLRGLRGPRAFGGWDHLRYVPEARPDCFSNRARNHDCHPGRLAHGLAPTAQPPGAQPPGARATRRLRSSGQAMGLVGQGPARWNSET